MPGILQARLKNGCLQRSSKSAVNCSNFWRLSVTTRCLGPVLSAVMKGRLISVCVTVDSSILAFFPPPRATLERLAVAAQVDALVAS